MYQRIAPPFLLPSLVLLLTQHAFADKFYFYSAGDQQKTVGNAANNNFVEGVLLKEDKDTYTIRILGGQMNIAKSMVTKIEQDGLTVAQLEAREAARMSALAQQDNNRRQVQAMEAAARKDARATEAAMPRDRSPAQLNIDVDFNGIIGHFRTGGRAVLPYDPVIRRANLSGLPTIVDAYMQALLDQQRASPTTARPDRSLPVVINFSSTLSPVHFETYQPSEVSQRDLDTLQQKIYSYVQEQVLLAAHRNPPAETMNLPYRSRQ